MRDLPHPPNWQKHLDPALFNQLSRPETQKLLGKINAEYLHWNKVRYQSRPEGMTAEQLWALVKLSRQPRKILPLLDIDGHPFSYFLPPSVQQILHEVDRGGGGILAVGEETQPVLNALQNRIIVSSLMEEAIATSQIEGAVTTREVAKRMLQIQRPPRNRSEQMIVNGYRTIQLLRERLDRPLSRELLFEIQESMTRDTLDDPSHGGAFRTASIPVSIVDSRDNQVVYTPPPAELLPERVDRLLDFANAPADKEDFIHPLIKAAVLHFWLAYEHPFVDGNGRTARALFYWWMLKSGYWLFEYLTISRAINRARIQYYHSFLFSEEDDNDLTYSIMFQLRATHQAINEMREYLARKQLEQQQIISVLRDAPDLNARQRAALQELMREPTKSYTFNSYRTENGVSLLTARADLIDLEERGYVCRVRSGRQFEFIAAPQLAKKLTKRKSN